MIHYFVLNAKVFNSYEEINDLTITIESYFSRVKHEKYHIYISRFKRDAVSCLIEFLKNTDEKVRVYAVGDDYVLFDCLNGIMYSQNVELAFVSMFRGNKITSLRQRIDITYKTIDKYVKADSVSTDIISCSNLFSLGFLTIGFPAYAALKLSKIMKKIQRQNNNFKDKICMFIYRFILCFDKSVHNQYYAISIDDKVIDGNYSAIYVENNYCSSCHDYLFYKTTPNDGFLDVILVKNIFEIGNLKSVLKYLNNDLTNADKHLLHVRGRELKIKSNKPIYVSLDGQTFMETEIEAQILPLAINFVVVDDEERAE